LAHHHKNQDGTSSQQLSWHIIATIKLVHHHNNYADTSSQQLSWYIITTIKLAHHQHKDGIVALGWHHKTTPPFEGGPYRRHQTYLESAQTLHEIEAWSTH
jgi:hypothetical protein